MKKTLILIMVVMAVVVGLFGYSRYLQKIVPKLTIEDEKVSISEYFVYGSYLNMTGMVQNIDTSYKEVKLVFYDSEGNFGEYDINTNLEGTSLQFNLAENINEGIYLDEIKDGEYTLFVRFAYTLEKEEEVVYKYYALENVTDYKETVYYTMSDINNKIVINSEEEYPTMKVTVSDNNNDNVYDIVIDPGHGGIDGGAVANGYKESDVTMSLARSLANKLEEAGYKVKLTREEESLTEGDYFDEYNDGGRAVISHEVFAKYVFSIHLNSNDASYVKGLEIYTSKGINYDFANSLVKNITDSVDIDISNNKTNKISEGVYTHNFTESEISANNERQMNKGYQTYDITTDSNYLYMIRETGGIMTGAYVDDRNSETVGFNPYYNSNIGAEAYLFEMGYLSNSSDVEILTSDADKISEAIVVAFNEKLNLEKK